MNTRWGVGGTRIIGVILAAAIAGPALGQENSPDLVRRLERQMRQIDETYRLAVDFDRPISERALYDVGASVRFGLFAVDNAEGSTRILRQTDTILAGRAELDGAHRVFGRLRFLYDDFNSGDSFDGRGDELAAPIGDRYWYEFDLRGARLAETGIDPDYNVNFRGGRQFINWGSGLSLSTALYAARVNARKGNLGFSGLIGLTPSTGTIDFDGSRPSYDTNTDRAFFGGAIQYLGQKHQPYFSVLVQRDHNDADFRDFDTPLGGIPTHFDYDSEYYAVGSRGTLGPQLAYRAEIVHQRGDGLSNSFDPNTGLAIDQTREDIDAWAGIGTLTWLLRDDADTRIDFEVLAGSGDDDRIDSSDTLGGNKPGTDDTSFNGLGYATTGLALAPEIANLLMFRVGASTSPIRSGRGADWLRLGVNGFLYGKVDSGAPISVRTEHDSFVGGEVNFAADWRVFSDLSVSMRYGLFIPGDAMPDDEDDPRHFFYAGVTYVF